MLASQAVQIAVDHAALEGDLHLPRRVAGLVIFAHGSGSSRFSQRNRAVAGALEQSGFGTLLLDLLTPAEEAVDEQTSEHRFDIELLGRRVIAAVDWAAGRADLRPLPVALFGASTGAAAALVASAARPEVTRAVISRGGRPDLADPVLPRVQAPTLLIVGEHDPAGALANRAAMKRMTAPVELHIVPGATHLFQEPGTLDRVAVLAAEWCRRYLSAPSR